MVVVKALALIGGFCAGIAASLALGFSFWQAALAALLALSCIGLNFRRPSAAFMLALCVALGVGVGITRTEFARSEPPGALLSGIGTRQILEGKIVADPDMREETQRLALLVRVEGETAKVLVVAPRFPAVQYGETVRAEGTLARPEPFATDAGRTFAYDHFLEKDGIQVLLENASVEVIGKRSGGMDTVRGFFFDLKRAGIDALARALPEPEASLAAGLVLGGKQGLGDELLDDFIVAGLVHIVVLSGYNVMIVAEAVLRAFAFLRKRYAAVAAGAVIAAFVLTAGAGAASIRAGIMAGIALFARATGKRYDALRALLFAGALMLLGNPLLLLYDPGFQLSFIATLGLIFGTPVIAARLSFVRSGLLRELLASTVAAQLSVLPLLLYQNGLFSLVALPANVLVLPVVPLAMAASAAAGFAGFLAPALAPYAGLPAYALLALIIGVVEHAASLPLAAVQVPSFPFLLTVLAYGALALLYVRLARAR